MPVAVEIVHPSLDLVTPRERFSEFEKIIEHCGRKSWKSEAQIGINTADPFIRKVAVHKHHESILEHCCITVDYVMSRAASHQLVRHRIAAYTQESQRFCDYSHPKYGSCLKVIVPPSYYSKDPDWRLTEATTYLPEGIPGGTVVVDHDEYELRATLPDGQVWCLRKKLYPGKFLVRLLNGYAGYLEDREAGIPAEDARFGIANASKTEVATTYNVRQWRHFFRMRCDKHAQWEIRGLAKQTLRLFIELSPTLFGDLVELTK